MIHLSDDEQRELHAVAEANRRDIRDEIILLALKALRGSQADKTTAKGGRDGCQEAA
ncbi:MAG TPA: hypothetical protein VNS63_17325 [Blastocatellia bacterium]|nr:hypothetical protein [Blastocatellia bacterium]